MRIAFFIHSNGNIATYQTSHSICVYEKTFSSWEIVQTIPTCLNPSIDLDMLRKTLHSIIEDLAPCTIIIAQKMIGLAYTLFDNRGFHIWEYEGIPTDHLCTIEQDELVLNYDLTKEKEPFSYFKSTKDGCYTIDVKTILFHDPLISSKKLLIPFLDHQPFYELLIVFSHIPPWLSQDLEKRHMEMQLLLQIDDRYIVSIKPKICSGVTNSAP